MRRTQGKEVDRAYVGVESMRGGYMDKAVVDVIWRGTDLEDCCVPNTMRTRGRQGKGLFIDLNGDHEMVSPIKELE